MSDASHVGEARRMTASLAADAGLEAPRLGELAIAVTEIGQNIVRHAGGRGEIVARLLEEKGVAGIEVLGIDRGPGIANLVLARRDGYSTQGTPGNGLGAIERQATEFDMYSAVGQGVVVLVRVWNARRTPSGPAPLRIGCVCVPKASESACGDAWRVVSTPERTLVLMVDGLGHGLPAADAARSALAIFDASVRFEPEAIVAALHAGLRPTRGAAVAVTEIRHDSHDLRFAGVGNIAGALTGAAGARSFVSHNGTAGVEARRIQALSYVWPPDAVLVQHSDGIATSWDLARYPGLRNRDAAVIAAVLYRDHRRERDDATVLVVQRERRAP